MPHEKPSLLNGPLEAITRGVVRRPVVVLASAVGLAVVAILASVVLLGFRTSRLDLLNPKSSYNKLWLDYIEEFGAADDVLVVVEADSPDRVKTVLEEVSRTLAREDCYFEHVLHGVDLAKVRAKGLHYLELPKLQALEQFVVEAEPIIEGRWTRLSVGNTATAMNGRLTQAARDPSGQARRYVEIEIEHWAYGLQCALATEPSYHSPWQRVSEPTITADLSDTSHFLMDDGRMGVVLLRLAERNSDGGFAQGTEAIDMLRKRIQSIEDRQEGVKIGLTGLPVLENDEMRCSQGAMIQASLLSLFGVACLFVAGFGGIRHPLLTVAALLLALAWSFGYITLAVGHLNILSVSFAVILIGLGIDFGVHYVARYMQLRKTVESCDEALSRTATGVGPGILTGAVTTSIAFFTAGLTEFTGVAELGIIAGGGILLCCLAALVVLPAMIHLTDSRRAEQPMAGPLDIHRWLGPIFRRPAWLFCVTIGVTTFIALGMSQLWYDHNLLNLQPKDLDSVRLERRLIDNSEQSVWFALSLAGSAEELLERKERFERLESVDRVEEIASLIPLDAARKGPIIERIGQRLANLPAQAPRIPIERLEALDPALAQLQTTLGGTDSSGRIAERIQWIRGTLGQMPESFRYQRLSWYQRRLAEDLLGGLQSIEAISEPQAPDFSDLPKSLVARFLGDDGRHLMRIYSRADIWDMDAMEQFVGEVRSVDDRVTGNPLQTYEASRQMKRSYEQAAWYALAAIFLVLFLDFRNLRHTLLAMLPVGLGMLQLFGILGWLGEPLNPANMIVLPLILGIGVDDGVHVVHDYLRCRGRYRMSPSTASAVTITSLTTMVGFGSLMIASHQGLQSLGRVLAIGVTCCLFTSLVMLPAALAWGSQDRRSEEEAEPNEPDRAESTASESDDDSPATLPYAA